MTSRTGGMMRGASPLAGNYRPCAALTAMGVPCRLPAMKDSEWCLRHQPKADGTEFPRVPPGASMSDAKPWVEDEGESSSGGALAAASSTSVPAVRSVRPKGRYAHLLPSSLAERFNASLMDRQLLSLRSEIALVDARLEDVLSHTNDAGDRATLGAWVELKKLNGILRDRRRRGDAQGMAMALNEIQKLIDLGATEEESWHEAYGLMEQRRKLAESEHKRLVALHQVLTAEEALTLVNMVVDAVRRHVTDRGQVASVSRELAALLYETQQAKGIVTQEMGAGREGADEIIDVEEVTP